MVWTKKYNGGEPQRVNKWLAAEGVCSRREAEALITDGLVSIDGARVDDVGRKIEPGQTLTLAEKAQRQLAGALTIVLNKPVRYVSAHPQGDEVPAARLLTLDNQWKPEPIDGGGKRLAKASFAPLGRLDQDSRGLLLLSEDGVLAKAIIGPQGEMEKEYVVRVRGAINDRKIALLRHGITLDKRALKPAKVDQLAEQTLKFVLREGMKRQIRRMCETVGLGVIDLVRLRIGPLKLGDLPEGKWRLLTPEERAALLG